jgi:hypothetical protein
MRRTCKSTTVEGALAKPVFDTFDVRWISSLISFFPHYYDVIPIASEDQQMPYRLSNNGISQEILS